MRQRKLRRAHGHHAVYLALSISYTILLPERFSVPELSYYLCGGHCLSDRVCAGPVGNQKASRNQVGSAGTG